MEFLLWLSGLRTQRCLCKDVGSIPGPSGLRNQHCRKLHYRLQIWLGIDCRHGLDLVLLWLWYKPTAAALIRCLALPYAADVAVKRKKFWKELCCTLQIMLYSSDVLLLISMHIQREKYGTYIDLRQTKDSQWLPFPSELVLLSFPNSCPPPFFSLKTLKTLLSLGQCKSLFLSIAYRCCPKWYWLCSLPWAQNCKEVSKVQLACLEMG